MKITKIGNDCGLTEYHVLLIINELKMTERSSMRNRWKDLFPNVKNFSMTPKGLSSEIYRHNKEKNKLETVKEMVCV